MLPHSLVTVKATSKALIAAFLVSRPVPLVNALYLAASTYFSYSSSVCNPSCVNGTCNGTTFTCDCADYFEGSDCSTPGMCVMIFLSPTHLSYSMYNISHALSLQSTMCQWSMQ